MVDVTFTFLHRIKKEMNHDSLDQPIALLILSEGNLSRIASLCEIVLCDRLGQNISKNPVNRLLIDEAALALKVLEMRPIMNTSYGLFHPKGLKMEISN